MTDIEAQAVRTAFSGMADRVISGKVHFKMIGQSGHGGADVVDPNGWVNVIVVSTEPIPSGSVELKVGGKSLASVT